MKKINILYCLTFALTMCVTTAYSQFEVKLNPIGVLFNSPDVSAEYIVSDEIGVELAIGLDYGKVTGSGVLDPDNKVTKSGYKLRLMGKYYFSPDDGADKFYAGLYLGPRSRTVKYSDTSAFDFGYKISAFTAGLTGGYKWVGDSGIVFELGIGIGRAFGDNIEYNDDTNTTTIGGFGIDGFSKAAIGYRF